MIQKLLIANRGEIACRIIRGVQATGRRAVAVYSEADAGSPHVRLADAAECIGPAPAAESYLNIDAILRAAEIAGADAVHPGYGFLSENAEFSQICADNDIEFIGPQPETMRLMSQKDVA